MRRNITIKVSPELAAMLARATISDKFSDDQTNDESIALIEEWIKIKREIRRVLRVPTASKRSAEPRTRPGFFKTGPAE